MDVFLQNNCLDSIGQVMGYHPDYLRVFLSTQQFLLRQDGPLNYQYRHYIAILAAGRHNCSYLVELYEQEFLMHNGNADWLKGLEHAPNKLRDLYELNKLLAHQPWLVTKEHMVKLLKSSEPWSLSELMHAIVLLVHFHSLSSFVFGCGISSELNCHGGHTYKESVLTDSITADSDAPNAKTSLPASNVESPCSMFAAANRMMKEESGDGDVANASQLLPMLNGAVSTNMKPCQACRSKRSSGDEVGQDSNGCAKLLKEENGMDVASIMEKMRQLTEGSGEEATQEELIKRFHSVEKNTAEIAAPSYRKPSSKSEVMKYVTDEDFCYEDFAKRKSIDEIVTFRACDYSWEDHGFSLANRLYADIGNYLDDKYNTAASMTYYTMGDLREVDTSSFRRAIWNYIHTIYGIRHDDYNYAEVNHLLAINLKAYIKILTCYPERIQKKDFEGVMKDFKHSEKVHVNLMLMEAKQQAALLYALRALNRYLT